MQNENDIKVGCCGWSYIDASKYFGHDWKTRFKSKLQAYSQLFDIVEINSTFYKLPRPNTARKWYEDISSIRKGFEFTIKVSNIITHKDRFSSKLSIKIFESVKEIAKELHAKILLFQSPPSFKPSEKNINYALNFFQKVDMEDFIAVWEVRWSKDWRKDVVEMVFSKAGVEQSIDPFRQNFNYNKRLTYLRLHGLGEHMYDYNFSIKELNHLKWMVRKKQKPCYIFFNNMSMYDNALEFMKILKLTTKKEII